MQETPSYHRQFFLILLNSNFLAITTWGSPILTTSEEINSILTTDTSPNDIISTRSNSSYSGDFPDNTKNRVFKFYFVIAAIVVTSFCVLALYLQRRRKLQTEIQKSHAEVVSSRNRADLNMARINDASIDNDCQVHGDREGNSEGWYGQGEAPPPYSPSSKPPDFAETNRLVSVSGRNEDMNTGLRHNSVELPPYNIHVMAVQNENIRDIGPARPLSCLNTREPVRF